MDKKITLLVLLFCLYNAYGQVKDQEILSRSTDGFPTIIKLGETRVADDINSIEDFLKKQYKTDDNTSFEKISNPKSEKGIIGQKFQQFYNGIKVEFAILNVVSKNGILKSINGKFVPVDNLKTTASLSENGALQSALNRIKAMEYAWQNQDKEDVIKKLKRNEKATYFPKGELVIIEKINIQRPQPPYWHINSIFMP